MKYAILCYDREDVVMAWTKEQDDAAIQKLLTVQQKLARDGKLGPVGRLSATKTARTLRKGEQSLVLDGPFAETKEQLLGFFIVEAANMDEAMEAAEQLARASSSKGAYEVRELTYFAANAGS